MTANTKEPDHSPQVKCYPGVTASLTCCLWVRNTPWQLGTPPEGLPPSAGTRSVCAGAGLQRSSGVRGRCVSQMLFQPAESGGKIF